MFLEELIKVFEFLAELIEKGKEAVRKLLI